MERLQKVIAHAGIASRRQAETMIAEGKVKVNGEVVRELGVKVSNNDRVEVNGLDLTKEEPVYFLLYKPRGVVSSAKDDKGRKTVCDFFVSVPERVYPIGRLDYDTSGLILMTNDGAFTNLLSHPRYQIEKTYVAKVKGIPKREQLRWLEKGVKLEDGKTAPAKVKLLSSDMGKQTSIIEMTIHEGRNRQVRRMFEAIGFPAVKLKREQYAFLNLRGLAPGEWRPLTPKEIKQLRNLAVTSSV